MKFCVVASKKDKAGMNIVEEIKKFSFLPVYLTEKEIINAENIDKEQNIQEDFIIFASKHESREKRKTLSIHAPGNWKKAEMGGKEGKVCKTSALFLKHLFKILNQKVEEQEEIKKNYQVTLEVTHHGPYIEKPCCFIEIGSSEEEWQDKKAGKVIARTIKKATDSFNQEARKKYKPAIGIGGKHYCPNFNKIQLNSEIALSHIIPQYIFPIDEKQVIEAIEKTKEKISLAIIDWKGLKSKERQKAIIILEKLNMPYKRTREIEK